MGKKFCFFSAFAGIFFLFFAAACGGGGADCLGAAPAAIFDAGMQGVRNHQFEVKGRESVERLQLPELAMSMEIAQSGCAELVQDFRLELDGTIKEVQGAAQTLRLVADIFGNLSQLGGDSGKERLRGFMDLAQLFGAEFMRFDAFDQPVDLTTDDGRVVQVRLSRLDEERRTLIVVGLRIR